MPFTTLISTDALAQQLGHRDLAIVDCRFRLDDVGWGAREYTTGHIPGAVYANLDRDLSGAKTGQNGRHPLPDPQTLASTLGRLGIDDSVQVVAYDQDSGMYASRLWWLLRWLGHRRVAVLDGGYAKWVGEARPTKQGDEHATARTFTGTPHDEMWIPVDRVAAALSAPAMKLIDARAPERFRGEQETIDRVAGHIPGASNHFFKTNLTDAGTFKPVDELRSTFTRLLGSTTPESAISYCGSGVTACHNLLALEHAGIHGVRLYPGSWSEWSSDPARPIETGESSGR